jgi:hypothetical protein
MADAADINVPASASAVNILLIVRLPLERTMWSDKGSVKHAATRITVNGTSNLGLFPELFVGPMPLLGGATRCA